MRRTRSGVSAALLIAATLASISLGGTAANAEVIDQTVLEELTLPLGVGTTCDNIPDGCDRTRIDPFDPLGQYFEVDGGGTLFAPEQTPNTTENYPRDNGRGNFTAVNVKQPTTSSGGAIPIKGVVGLDFSLGNGYRPCGNARDTYNGACQQPGQTGSYLRSFNWAAGGSTDYGSGMFIGNSSSKPSCTSPCMHYWGQRVSRIDVEFYGRNSNNETNVQYVRPRFAVVNNFPVRANGGSYTNALGTVPLAQLGEAGVGRLAGFVTRNGVGVGAKDASVRIFQAGTGGQTSGGQRLQTFATPNTNGGGNGFYSTGAIYVGNYTVRVVDNVNKTCLKFTNVNLQASSSRIDYDLAQRNFGRSETGSAC
jgi:hypothetical protein